MTKTKKLLLPALAWWCFVEGAYLRTGYLGMVLAMPHCCGHLTVLVLLLISSRPHQFPEASELCVAAPQNFGNVIARMGQGNKSNRRFRLRSRRPRSFVCPLALTLAAFNLSQPQSEPGDQVRRATLAASYRPEPRLRSCMCIATSSHGLGPLPIFSCVHPRTLQQTDRAAPYLCHGRLASPGYY